MADGIPPDKSTTPEDMASDGNGTNKSTVTDKLADESTNKSVVPEPTAASNDAQGPSKPSADMRTIMTMIMKLEDDREETDTRHSQEHLAMMTALSSLHQRLDTIESYQQRNNSQMTNAGSTAGPAYTKNLPLNNPVAVLQPVNNDASTSLGHNSTTPRLSNSKVVPVTASNPAPAYIGHKGTAAHGPPPAPEKASLTHSNSFTGDNRATAAMAIDSMLMLTGAKTTLSTVNTSKPLTQKRKLANDDQEEDTDCIISLTRSVTRGRMMAGANRPARRQRTTPKSDGEQVDGEQAMQEDDVAKGFETAKESKIRAWENLELYELPGTWELNESGTLPGVQPLALRKSNLFISFTALKRIALVTDRTLTSNQQRHIQKTRFSPSDIRTSGRESWARLWVIESCSKEWNCAQIMKPLIDKAIELGNASKVAERLRKLHSLLV
ncbi:uncharacterized protein K452DRAFT_300704 [Aplosporella prunicola CBS 121167]|uniref:Uncharacterized protein n=1 Tax=Aplosporella prunicola CBS 121167 TaxID=1176127 RepID=A0A6A6B7E0_9PEZI|nr:uncharacterized protein K452DRAFT_300704 [Aplosporella prunicola CBS 121167]KAF2139155.1 hypothetical protein K452DRAFT_300704 [Aplosporella prunicola CBS 121167]